MNWSTRRIILLGVTALALLVLAGRLIDLQLIHADYYRQVANDNRIRAIPIVAPRGKIYDRNGIELAGNRPAFSIAVVPADFRGNEPQQRLASVLEMPQGELSRRLKQRRGLPLEPVGVRRDADLRMISRLEERIEEYSGVVISTDPVRLYPDDGWAGHLLGYTREVSEGDRGRSDRSGAPLRGVVGAAGLERKYDESLRGIDGVGYRQVNAFGQMLGPMPGYEDVQPIPGDDLRLAIDLDLQRLADSLLSGYTAGTVVAIEVKTGALVCFVTRPGFDANHFIGGMSTAEWNALRTDSLHPLLSRATMGVYPPGSTFKLVTAATGLESHAVQPNQRFSPCTGGYRFGNRVFGCWKAGGHGSLDLLGAIEQSCDVYFYQLIQKTDLDQWSAIARGSGFGRITQIDLPGEANGLVPGTEYYDRTFGTKGWTRGVLLNLSIGQGELNCTPLQLAVYYAAVANNGVAMRPHLLDARRMPGEQWTTVPHEELYRLPYSAGTLNLLQQGCQRVVTAEHGTARAIKDPLVRIAGKTGTAQNPHGEDHAWFASYAPFEAPQIAVVALVEKVGHGSEFAAPICYQIARAYLGVPPKSQRTTALLESTESGTE